MERLLKNLSRFPWVILILLLIISAGFFKIMKTNSRMETDLDSYMPQSHPAFVYSNQAEDWFNIKDGIIIAIENQNGIYNAGTIDKVRKLTKDLQSMEQINKDDVTSLYTADNIIGTEDGLDVKPFFKRTPKTLEALEQLRTNVRNNEMIFERLVSGDEKVTVIIAEINDDVLRNLNTDLLRRAYKARIFKNHPDRLGAASDSMVRLKTKECQQINEAYQTLKHFVRERNEWIYSILTSYDYQASYSPAEGTERQGNHSRRDILERLKRHIHPFTSSFRGFFREVPGESARPL